MPSNLPRFTIRTEQDILDKLSYIASLNERSGTQEIVYLIKNHIKEFEAKNGKLIIEEDRTVHTEETYKVGKSSTSKIG